MNIAQSSMEEARYYLLLANDLGYFEDQQLFADLDEVGRLLGTYARRLLTPNS